MAPQSPTVDTDAGDVFRHILAETSGEVLATGLDEETTGEFIEVLAEVGEPLTVHLLAQESVLKWLRGDFLAASVAAELVDAGRLSLRTTDGRFENALVVTDESVIAIVPAGQRVAGLVTDDAEFVATARERWTNRWESAEEFSLRTPARSRVEESLEAAFGPAVAADFRTMLGALETARGEDGIDEVVVSLLVAAKNEVLLYDISKWGEDTGVASKATFSRTKTRLEERGVIDTEKVPIDVGRPRLRLLLGDERLQDADADELVSVAQGILSATPA